MKIRLAVVLTLQLASLVSLCRAAPANSVPEVLADKFMQMAQECVHREYPNKIAHVLDSDQDAAPPRSLHPVFYGCFDWHSSVHGHWLLVRLLRLNPDSSRAPAARAALERSFERGAVEVETQYLNGDKNFERPYGTAWLLQLMSELREWDDPDARRWYEILLPLEQAAVAQYLAWLPNLAYPIRLGTHNQTAFAFALTLDWARGAEHTQLETLLAEKILSFHKDDRQCPLGYEPSGEDFLSPCLMEADLMRRVLSQDQFATWLGEFLPEIPVDTDVEWLSPGIVLDPTDGKLVHLDGVNLSRAWNLVAIADALPTSDPRRAALLVASGQHAETGLASVSSEHYEGGHWLASFATYYVSERWRQP